MQVEPAPSPSRIIFTKHADVRLHERAPAFDLDRARTEITEALLSRRYTHRAKNIWYAWTLDELRMYVLARTRHGKATVVITVLTPQPVLH